MAYTSKHAYVLIGQESTWGTPVTADKDVGLVQNLTMNESNNLKEIHAITTVATQAIVAGKYTAAGTLEANFQHGRLLEYVFGSVAHAETTGDWKHTYSEADALPSFTLEDGYNSTSDSVQTYAGCRITSATIGLDLDGVITLSAEFVAKTVADTTSASSSVVSSLAPLPSYSASLKTGTDSSEATVAEVQTARITINNNAGGEANIWGIGSRLATGSEPNGRTYEFAFTLGFSNQTEYELFLGGTSPAGTSTPTVNSLVFNANNGVTLGSGRLELNIELANVSYESVSKKTSVGSYILLDVTGKATGIQANTFSVDTITSTLWS